MEHLLAAATANVLEMGVKMPVSVVDPRGDGMATFQTDGASWRTPPISRAKAVAACFSRASSDLTAHALSPVLRGLIAMEGPPMLPGRGHDRSLAMGNFSGGGRQWRDSPAG